MGRSSPICVSCASKEPVLSRPHRHRAPGTASRGAGRLAAARLALQRSRARVLLVLATTCAFLLIAAPIALLVSGGNDGDGSSGDPDGVFTGDGPALPDGGAARGGSGIATESAASPSPGTPPVAGASGGVAGTDGSAGAATAGGGAAGGAASGGAGSGGTGSGGAGGGIGGTAAGASAPAGGGSRGGGGSSGGSGSGPSAGDEAPQNGTPGQSPSEDDEDGGDCGCPENPLDPVTDVVDGLTDTTGELVGGLVP